MDVINRAVFLKIMDTVFNCNTGCVYVRMSLLAHVNSSLDLNCHNLKATLILAKGRF